MVAFSYTRASSNREISKAVDQAIEQTFGTTQDQVSQQNRTTNELIRQLNQSRSNLGEETYDTYRNRLETYKQNLNTEYDQVVQAQQNINIRAANQTADRDVLATKDTRSVRFVSEDFTAASAEQAEAMAKENLAAQAKIQFGENYDLKNYDIRTRLLNDGTTGATTGYTSYVVADGSGTAETRPDNPVTPEENIRINTFQPSIGETDLVSPNIPNLSDFEINVAPEKNDDSSVNDTNGPFRVDVAGTNNPIFGPNRLHVYSTYTYGVSLHFMTIKEYNAFVSGRERYSPRNNRVLIASGGRRNTELVRNPNFDLDMYISDLKMTTVIGSNPISKGSNAVSIEFTIHEPISASLIERFVALAQENDIQNWIDMPLVLQIDFFGINPDGTYVTQPIEGVTKYLCVKIVNMSFEITNKGAEYKCTATPQSHQAFSKSAITIPANFEITARTVGEFFAASENASKVDLEGHQTTREVREAETPGNKQSNSFKVLSLADALNQYQIALTKPIKGKKYQDYADEYRFEIDPELVSATLTVPNKHDLSNAPM